MANSFAAQTYPEIWATGLQERLTGPTNWKETCEVHMMNDRTLNLPYMSTEFSLQSGTRGTAYSHSDFTLTNDTLTVSAQDIVSVFLDRADAAQQKFVGALEAGRRQGDIINERVEDLVLANHAAWTNFGSDGAGGFGLYDVTFTVTVANIDSVSRAIKREIIKAKGSKIARRNGIFIVWRPEDFEKLEESMASQGYTFADAALKDGIMDADGQGKYAFGVYHYVSESHTAGHVFAGVRKIQQIGLLKSTFGRIYYNPNAVNADGPLSGESHEARLDYGLNAKAGLTALLFDMRVV
ncbi:MAG: hypothetical protein AAB706_01540 [Patescibacteria group bacterium]